MDSVEAICNVAHNASEDEIRGRIQRLSAKARRVGSKVWIVACQRAIMSNPDVGVCRAFLEQILENVNQYVRDSNSARITLLHSAVLRPTPDGGEVVKMLLRIPEVDLNVVAYRGRLTLLHLACLLSRYEIVDLLLNDRRVELSAKTSVGNRTALHCACGALLDELGFGKTSLGPTCKKLDVVRILLKAAATNIGSLRRFLNERDSRGRTALHYAAESNHTAIVEEIFNAVGVGEPLDDAVARAEDSEDRMPVHLAAQKGHKEVVSLLLRRAPRTFYSKDAEGLTPFHHSIRGGHLQVVQDWISQYIPKSASASLNEQKIVKTFVELFKITSHYEVAFFLLKELDQQLQQLGHTASLLRWAVESKSGYGAILIPQILKWKPNLANTILDQQRKQTPLHVATISGRLDVVEALCAEEGWWLRAKKKDKYNKTALDYGHDLGHEEICEHLMQRADMKEFVSKLQKERGTYVTGANAILVVAVLIAGASFASCVKPPETVSQTPGDPLTPCVNPAPLKPLHLMVATTFLTSIAATILGAFASLPFSFGLYTGSFSFKRASARCQSDYIGHKVGRVRVLVALASYFLLASFASMVYSFLCASEFGTGAAERTLFACTVFTVTLASVTLLVFATYFGRAIYCKFKQLAWRSRMSSEVGFRVRVHECLMV